MSVTRAPGWVRRVASAGALVLGVSIVALPAVAGAADHSVFGFGDTDFHGSTGKTALNFPIVAMAGTPDGDGYWLVSKEGRVATFGEADSFGSVPMASRQHPVVAVAARPSGAGYWIAADDGSVFAFGDAPFFGSLGGQRLNQPIVGMAATPSGRGYWLVARDGGIFAFGDARFHGSTGAIRLNQAVVGMAATPSGTGYWLVARDGGIFSFGTAQFQGSTGGIRLTRSIVGMAVDFDGGYWLVASDGGVFAFGGASFHGSLGGTGLTEPVVGMVAAPGGDGYWLATTGHLAPVTDARPEEARIAEGTFKVGDGGVRPGTYRIQQAGPACEWARLASAPGEPVELISGGTAAEGEIVTIKAGDGAFYSSGCGSWTTDLFPTRFSRTAPVGDGTWMVHIDVAPGTWQAAGGPDCVWGRVRGFGWEPADIIELGEGENPEVTILTGDRAFTAENCGTWTRV